MSLCELWFDCDEHVGRLKLYSTYLICDCLLYYLVLLLNGKFVTYTVLFPIDAQCASAKAWVRVY